MSERQDSSVSPAQSECDPSPSKQAPSWLGRACKEPLVHFLLLGAGLFVAYRLTADSNKGKSPDTILVSQQRIGSLIETFTRTWQRPPTTQELNGLIDDYVKEEVFYREALKMGLDQDDTLIRRRLRQKLEFLAEDFANVTEPSDRELQQLLDERPEDYRVDRRFGFNQVFLRRDRDGQPAEQFAAELLKQLNQGNAALQIDQLGDRTMLPQVVDTQSETQIAGEFGPKFSEAISDLAIGEWSGPIESTYGLHLVLLREATPGRQPELPAVRDLLRREWFADRRAKSKQKFFDSLRQQYKVTIEPLDEEFQSREAKQ